ncbi:MAG: hypothetical protein ACOCV8_00260 [Spirochaetota bacterium]
MSNTAEVLELLEEKLTQAIQKLKHTEREKNELIEKLNSEKEKEEKYKNISEENTKLKNQLRNTLEELEQYKKYKNIGEENIKLKDEIRRLNEEMVYYKNKNEVLMSEVNTLRKIRDTVRARVVQLISKLEGEKSTSADSGNIYNDINETLDSENYIDIYEEESNTKKKIDNEEDELSSSIGIEENISFYNENYNEDNSSKDDSKEESLETDINFFVEEDEDEENTTNSNKHNRKNKIGRNYDKDNGEQENLF